MAIDRRLVLNIDWVLLAAVLALCGIGVFTIYSAKPDLAVKQTYCLGLGFVALVVCISLDYRRLADRAPWLYILTVAVLFYVLVFGPKTAGTRRWIHLGGVQVQPSEIAKLVASLFVAKVFAETRKESLGITDILGPGAAIGVMLVLIAAEPDLGSAFCLVPLFMTGAFLAGLRGRAIVMMLLAGLVVGGLGWQFALRDYQKSRIYTFLDPSLDPKGAGYQSIQSQIAVGSGGLWGKGYRKGSQSQLGYLPARHTDFILSVLAEEMGFAGVVVVLGLYLLVLFRAFETAQMARDRVGAFLAAGVAATLAFQVVYNAAMIAGLVPVKGLPLPLMSYGGSSVISSLLAVGLILNVRMRRFAN